MSSIAVFLVLGGATAFAVSKIGSNQLKANSVTTGKIKNGAVTGSKVKLSTLGTVPNSAATDVIKTSKGTLTGAFTSWQDGSRNSVPPRPKKNGN